MMLTTEDIRTVVSGLAKQYHVRQISLFGSRAAGTSRNDSDVDLIVEFFDPVTLLTLSQLRCQLEDALHLDVDLVHGPLRDDDLLELGEVIELYAA